MQEQLLEFLQSPNRDTFLAIRGEIVGSDSYNPYSTDLGEAVALIDEGRHEEAQALLREAMPNLLLSPRAHSMLGYLARESGDSDAAEAHRMITSACCMGIISTGEGTQENPYQVLRTTDEYDIVQYFEKSVASQMLIQKDEQSCDVLECEDGTIYWFDVTDAFNRDNETKGGDETE